MGNVKLLIAASALAASIVSGDTSCYKPLPTQCQFSTDFYDPDNPPTFSDGCGSQQSAHTKVCSEGWNTTDGCSGNPAIHWDLRLRACKIMSDCGLAPCDASGTGLGTPTNCMPTSSNQCCYCNTLVIDNYADGIMQYVPTFGAPCSCDTPPPVPQ